MQTYEQKILIKGHDEGQARAIAACCRLICNRVTAPPCTKQGWRIVAFIDVQAEPWHNDNELWKQGAKKIRNHLAHNELPANFIG